MYSFKRNYLEGRVCFKLYLLIPGNKMIEMYMPMFVTSLLNFIPGYKMFLGIENFPKENDGNKFPWR